MFDLFRSRDKMVRFFLGALLVLVSLSMLTYLIPSYGSGDSASDIVVAEIGEETLTLPEVQRNLQLTLRNQQIPPQVLPHYVPQVIEGMITERAMAYQAERLGLKVSEQDVAQAIRSMIPSLFPDGKFVGRETYAAMLAQQNMSIPEFEASLQRQLLVNRLRNIAVEGTAVVPPQEIEREFRQRNAKAKIEYVRVTGDRYRSQAQVTPDEVRAYYNRTQAQYQVPEKRSLAILVLDQSKVEQSVAATEAELQKLYNQSKERFRTPERVKVRHILLKTTDKPDQEAAIKAKAEDLLKQIRGGANFATLAGKHSEDPGSAATGGELPDWVARGQTVPEFEETAFNLKPGETSGVVKTQYGFHIIQLVAKEPARLRPFEEVKAELAADYKKQRLNDMLQTVSDRAQAALQKDPQNPEKVAAEFGMQVVRVEKVGPGDPLPEVGVSQDFENSIAALNKGEVSQPVLVAGNKLVLAVATDVFPAHQASFEEAQAEARAAVEKEKLNTLVVQRATELAEKARSMGGDLRKAAQSMGMEVKASEEFSRVGAVEGLGSAAFVADAFSKPVGTVSGPVTLPDAHVVYKVTGRTEANMAELAAQREAIRDEVQQRLARERNTLFEDGLRETLIKEGKIKIHQDVVNRLLANYRG
jgi:peptidyl-prolyl cis-trans isomerase D